MQPGHKPDRKMVLAVANYVVGAVHDMTDRQRVKVIDSTNGRSYRVPSDESAIPADHLELAVQEEQKREQKILKVLSHMQNVLVAVTVKLEVFKDRREETTEYDKDKSFTLVTEETSSKSSTSDGSSGGGEPGVVPNTGVSAVAINSASSASRSSDSEETSKLVPGLSGHKTSVVHASGQVKEVTATVNIPRSYFVAAFKAETGNEEEPEANVLNDFITQQIAKIRPQVRTAIGLAGDADDEKVVIAAYPDLPHEQPTEPVQASTGGFIASIMDNAAALGLSGLALISLLLMLLMMRRAASSVTVAAERPSSSGSSQAASGDGERRKGGSIISPLDDMELDEESQRTQKMVEQVTGMVQQDPDAAASLVRRWIGKKSN
jgi:flagellar biosynthesis/type III secretory pathway M-ring protein FliF/YscJ